MAEDTMASIVEDGLRTGFRAQAAVLPLGGLRMALDAQWRLRPRDGRALSPADQKAVRQLCPGIDSTQEAGRTVAGVANQPVSGPVASRIPAMSAAPIPTLQDALQPHRKGASAFLIL